MTYYHVPWCCGSKNETGSLLSRFISTPVLLKPYQRYLPCARYRTLSCQLPPLSHHFSFLLQLFLKHHLPLCVLWTISPSSLLTCCRANGVLSNLIGYAILLHFSTSCGIQYHPSVKTMSPCIFSVDRRFFCDLGLWFTVFPFPKFGISSWGKKAGPSESAEPRSLSISPFSG